MLPDDLSQVWVCSWVGVGESFGGSGGKIEGALSIDDELGVSEGDGAEGELGGSSFKTVSACEADFILLNSVGGVDSEFALNALGHVVHFGASSNELGSVSITRCRADRKSVPTVGICCGLADVRPPWPGRGLIVSGSITSNDRLPQHAKNRRFAALTAPTLLDAFTRESLCSFCPNS